jgi:hypothetical protein
MSETSMADILNNAVSAGAPYETIARLAELLERNINAEALKSFNTAMALAKAEVGPILKDQHVDDVAGSYDYASFPQVQRTLDPVASGVGISYRFRCIQSGNDVTVACVVSHTDGHSEETSLTSVVETSPKLSATQSLGMVVSMLQRLTVMSAFGLSAYKDEDCRKSLATGDNGLITLEQAAELQELCLEIKRPEDRFLKFLSTAIGRPLAVWGDIPANQFDRAKKTLEAKRTA